jgi:signal transduction histidine kinase
MAENAGDARDRHTVETLLAEAATENERAISGVRALMALTLAVRFFLISAHTSDASGPARTGLVLPTALLAIVFSLVFLHRSHRRPVAWPWLAAATGVDAAVAFLSLLGDALFPGASYVGALYSADTALVLLITVVAGFRLSVPLALLGGGLNGAGVATLILLDHHLALVPVRYEAQTSLMWLVLVASAGAVAAVAAGRARTLALRAAEESLRRERALRDLGLVLEGHHDAQGVLSAALLNSERLVQMFGEPGAGERSRLDVARRLAEDLDLLAGCVGRVRQDADGRVTASLPVVEVDVAAGATEVLEALDGALPGVHVERIGEQAAAKALLAGGKHGLSRLLWNLLKNAHDGDGRRGAHRVRLTVESSEGEVRLSVEDDGPGFAAGRGAGGSAKPGGLGVGLESVRALVERSGGRVDFGESALGGALVRVSLRAR